MANKLYAGIEGVIAFPIEKARPHDPDILTSMKSFRDATIIDMEEAAEQLKQMRQNPDAFVGALTDIYVRFPATMAQATAQNMQFWGSFFTIASQHMAAFGKRYEDALPEPKS